MGKMNIAINGFGRIGRSAFKIALEKKHIDIVAINDLTDSQTLAHLLKYDTAYGVYERDVQWGEGYIQVDKKKIPVLAEKDPTKLPWKKLKVDCVFESAGIFNKGGRGAHAHPGRRAPGDCFRADFRRGRHPDFFARRERREIQGRGGHFQRLLHDQFDRSRRGRDP